MAYTPPGGPQACFAGNRGAITTTFTPPAECLSTTSVLIRGIAVPPPQQGIYYYIGFWEEGAPGDLPLTFNDPCLPPAVTPINFGPYYYSPGICPSAYTPASRLLTIPNICLTEAALAESVTAWVCCPPGYSFPPITITDDTYWSVCISSGIGPVTLTSVWPVSYVSAAEDFPSSTIWPVSAPGGIIQPLQVITNPTVIAQGVTIMWESTDTEVLSWFAQQKVATDAVTTGAHPMQTGTAAGPTNTTTSRASKRSKANKLSVALLGAAYLISIIFLSS